MKEKILIGSRGSQLAMYQAQLTKTKLEAQFPAVQIEIVLIKTSGDVRTSTTFSPLETKRVFTREIEEALIKGDVDIAVHSAKDMAAILPEGTEIGAVLEREDSRDCLIARDGLKLKELPEGARIGTSSIRRKKQLLKNYPNLQIEEIRGNVDTRIGKVKKGEIDAIVLAHAGVKRLELTAGVTDIFEHISFLPAPGQGAIVIQQRTADEDVRQMLRTINHIESEKELACERAFLQTLQGGCQLPCGMVTYLTEESIRTEAILFDLETDHFVEASLEGARSDASAIGHGLAEKLIESGGREILERISKDYS